MKKQITFNQLKRLVKEATNDATYKDPHSGFEFESKELRDITPVDKDDFQTELSYACCPTFLFAPDEDAAGGVLTSDFFQEQYDLLFKVADMFDKSGEPALKESAASIRSLVKPYADKLKAYMDGAGARQRAADAKKQKRREQYLKLRDEFKDEDL